MSQENVEIVRKAIEAWNAGDMDAFRELCDADVVMHHVEDWPEPGPTVGREAVMRFIEQLRDTWDADTIEVTSDFLHAADRVVFGFTWHGRGHGPRVEHRIDDRLWRPQGQNPQSWSSSGITRKPSKPPGCRSRRCRRRT